MQNGYEPEEFAGRPVIAIVNTWSDLNTCHGHLREVAEVVKRGVWQAGGHPVEVPAMSLGEIMMKPTAMLYRNLLAMQVEEQLRSQPIDGAVLLGGCDKTTPGLLMGAISMNIPAIYVPAGFMLHGFWRGERLGSGVDAWKYAPELLAGRITFDDWAEIERGSALTVGTCNTLGTASTMTAVAEALGLTMPGASSVPAVHAAQRRLAAAAGRRIVELVGEDAPVRSLLSPASFHNAMVVAMAMGGSTNAAIHLLALAGRTGVPLTLADLDRVAREVPVLVDVMPSGRGLMEDFAEAGGSLGLLSRLRPLLRTDAHTVSGRTIGELADSGEVFDEQVIRPLENPVARECLGVLHGNLAPDGAVIKISAASERLAHHRGPALVFDGKDDIDARIHDPDLPVQADSVLILRGVGPRGGPGMPEWGMLPIPLKLYQQGVRDMVRISDARMSGTSYGTVVLHVSPEAHVGGPLALVRDGDPVELDIDARRLHLHVDAEELERRRRAWTEPAPRFARGYGALAAEHMQQANLGCDMDFLTGTAPTPEPKISY
jgi:dihydroxy-acid dehydratase